MGSGGVASYGYNIAVSSDCKQVLTCDVNAWATGNSMIGQWWQHDGQQFSLCNKQYQQLLQPMMMSCNAVVMGSSIG